MSPPVAHNPRAVGTPATPRRPATIVIAEDDRDIRLLLVDKLRRSGLEVSAADDGLAALKAIREQLPDIAILDVQMPHLSGIEVCREVRADPRTADLPIIMLTARARPQDLDLAFAAGADDYVVKPFSPRQLLTRVETILSRVQAG